MGAQQMLLRTITFITAVAIAGCSLGVPLQVDSISNPNLPAEKTYVLLSGVPQVGSEDLYFQEFSRYFREILARAGYSEARSPAQAALAIYLGYGMSTGETVRYAHSLPVYGVEGGETITLRETTRDAAGAVTETTRTFLVPMHQRVVGQDLRVGTYVNYTAFATLEARPAGEDRKGPTFWRITVTSTTESRDLRRLMPYMAAAAAPYIGRNTGEAVRIKLQSDDPLVKGLRAPESAR